MAECMLKEMLVLHYGPKSRLDLLIGNKQYSHFLPPKHSHKPRNNFGIFHFEFIWKMK